MAYWEKKANLKGPRGIPGPKNKLEIGAIEETDTAYAYFTGDDTQQLQLGLPRGAQGLPGVNAVPADEAVAGFISTPGDSETRTALDATYIRKGDIEISVKDFGAVGDGITDDQAAVQQAALAAYGTFGLGGKLVFPEGTYYWPGVVELYSNLIVEGRGATLVKRLPSDSTMLFGLYSRGKTGYGSGVTNLTIRGLKIKGDFANGRSAGGFGANHASHVLVEDCTFEQCLAVGHVFDLGGCDDITFRRCVFMGRSVTDTANIYNECIQVDNSTRSGTSAVDDAGSYDGLPSKNITVEKCQFLPITVGGVGYPAGNPFGSHYGLEGFPHENLKFLDNIVDTPVSDTTSNYRGTLHFMAARNVTISGNTFINRLGTPGRAISTLNLLSSFRVADAGASPMPTYTLAVPMMCHDLTIEKNMFIGYNDPGTAESILMIRGNTAANMITGLRIKDNKFRDCYVRDLDSNSGPNQMELTYCRDIRIQSNTSDGARRLIYFGTVNDIQISGNSIRNSSNGYGINGINGVNVRIVDNEFFNYSGGVYVSNSEAVIVRGNGFTADRSGSGPAINLTGCTRIKATENDAISTAKTTTGIYVNGGSGFIRNNAVAGFVTQIFIGGGSTATQSGNDTV